MTFITMLVCSFILYILLIFSIGNFFEKPRNREHNLLGIRCGNTLDDSGQFDPKDFISHPETLRDIGIEFSGSHAATLNSVSFFPRCLYQFPDKYVTLKLPVVCNVNDKLPVFRVLTRRASTNEKVAKEPVCNEESSLLLLPPPPSPSSLSTTYS